MPLSHAEIHFSGRPPDAHRNRGGGSESSKPRRIAAFNGWLRKRAVPFKFGRCRKCGCRVLFGYKAATGVFCSRECRGDYSGGTFCEDCLRETVAVSAGNTYTLNGFGIRLHGGSRRCPRFASTVCRLYYCLLFVPVCPVPGGGEYRVIYHGPSTYISRRVGGNPIVYY